MERADRVGAWLATTTCLQVLGECGKQSTQCIAFHIHPTPEKETSARRPHENIVLKAFSSMSSVLSVTTLRVTETRVFTRLHDRRSSLLRLSSRPISPRHGVRVPRTILQIGAPTSQSPQLEALEGQVTRAVWGNTELQCGKYNIIMFPVGIKICFLCPSMLLIIFASDILHIKYLKTLQGCVSSFHSEMCLVNQVKCIIFYGQRTKRAREMRYHTLLPLAYTLYSTYCGIIHGELRNATIVFLKEMQSLKNAVMALFCMMPPQAVYIPTACCVQAKWFGSVAHQQCTVLYELCSMTSHLFNVCPGGVSVHT